MDDSNTVAMSAQQRGMAQGGTSRFTRYRDLAVGDESWAHLAAYELVTLFTCGAPGALGLALRAALLPMILGKTGRGLTVGKGVTIRQPKNLQFGNHVFLDDYSVLDVRRRNGVGSITLGDHVLIGRGSLVVAKEGTISFGNAVNVSSYCRIATQSSVTIEESVLIAAYAYIGPGNHRIDDLSTPLIEQGMDIRGGVHIGAHSWIGAHSTILDGVKIGKNVVVGAHSLVKDDIPDNAIVAGTPAKVIRFRNEVGAG